MRTFCMKTAVAGLACSIALMLMVTRAMGQESEWNTWTSVELNKQIGKKLEIFVTPEIRFTDQFKVDEYFIETGLEYDLWKFLSIGGSYRFLINERETKSTEYFHRIAFDVKGKYEINRFNFQLRTRYTNYDEFGTDNTSNDRYLRYRLKVDYNISKSKFTPNIGVEFFRQLEDKEFDKVRYIIGGDYKINKHHKIGLDFLMQDYLNEDYMKNIVSLRYTIKF